MLPIPLQDPTMLMEVSEKTWRAVFDAAGESKRLAAQSFKHADIQNSFEREPPGPELFDALEIIHDLGTDEGRTQIEQVAQDQPIKLPISPESTPAREFAAQLWVHGKADPGISDLLFRAQLTQLPKDSTRTYREFVSAGSAPEASIDKDQVKDAISQWCRNNGKGDVVLIATLDYGGEWYCHVIRGDPIKRVPEVRKQRLGVLHYQPAASDLLRYDPKTGRIGIATRSPQLLKAYRNVLGTLVAGNDQFFAGENICSLRPLQDTGKRLFDAHRQLGITRVDVVQLLWRRGDRDKVWVSGRDCFQILDDLQAKLREGELIEARLKIGFTGSLRSANATLKVPNIIQITGPHQDLVEQLLDATGLRGSFDSDGTPRNFWSEHPWRLKEVEWRRRLAADFDRLVKTGALQAVMLEAAVHPDHPHAAGALEVVDIAPHVAMGVSSDAAIGVRTLTVSDIQGYQLQILPLAREIQSILGLEGGCQEVASSSGLWNVGARTFGPGLRMAVFLAAREPGAAAAAIIAAAANGATPLVLYPQGCRGIDGLACAACRLPQGPHGSLMEEAIRSLKWQDQIAPIEWSSAELVIDVARGVVTYKGLKIATIQPDSHPFKFAVTVAGAQGEVVSTEDLNRLLSARRPDKDAVKTAKSDFLKAVRAAHKNNIGTALVDPIFESVRGGYRLTSTALVHV